MFLFPKANPQGFTSGLEAHVSEAGARWLSHQDRT